MVAKCKKEKINELYDEKKCNTYSQNFRSNIHSLHGHFDHTRESVADNVYLLVSLFVNNVLSDHFLTFSSSFARAAPLPFSI